MIVQTPHTFHIPVMGLGFTIDTPAKVARYGISSVISIQEDNLIEQMREHYCGVANTPYIPIPEKDIDHRAKRITAYLDLLDELTSNQLYEISTQKFTGTNDIDRYFLMLDDEAPFKKIYKKMLATSDIQVKKVYEEVLRRSLKRGNIDVNIMTKCDRANNDDNGEKLPYEYSDAAAALRGFAKSRLSSSVVFSAGMNPRLFSYCESFDEFYPDQEGHLNKSIIVKVSDFRSADIQGKFLAKKGLWVSEFRIESGLNCGGHVFPTDGLLLGPILEQFQERKETLRNELFEIVNKALVAKGRQPFSTIPGIRLSVQGGIGTSEENSFLLNRYKVDSTGWGSPFLLVPEATNVDEESMNKLTKAKPEDYYVSYASPLGIGFNNFRHSSSEIQRKERIRKNRPGSPCYKKFLAFNTEFTKDPICTASRKYQHLKITQLQASDLNEKEKEEQINRVLEKDCLCEGLASPALLVNKIKVPRNLTAVTLCPGPNLAYFSKLSSLQEMVDHIYGRADIMNKLPRAHMFINELNMYIEHYQKKIVTGSNELGMQIKNNLQSYKANLIEGINYYMDLFPACITELTAKRELLMNS